MSAPYYADGWRVTLASGETFNVPGGLRLTDDGLYLAGRGFVPVGDSRAPMKTSGLTRTHAWSG
ncbi:hypothetical protein [Geodermatophilus sp. DSM 45219]|uniref:hypothetical protein n=1 Tax=Geodermatophilus sp. DSM 45219 TaxID=1881103 RepID=UPI00088C2582|nr:hypothetical protein [Geodermatophilus sp. DSM 45219]SDO15398.1 hypothetical protein SAMN05428965_2899 [Geodermatophilus sp. DSM 45219]